MNDIADDLIYALVCELADRGEEFHARELKAFLAISYPDLQMELRRLQAAGVIKFTGRVCMWQRVR